MSEQQIIALLKSINIKVEALQTQMIMFQEALQPDLEYEKKDIHPNEVSEDKPEPEVKKEILMDLTNVTIMAQTPKAVLAVKKGFQKWIPLSCLNEEGYELGSQYDLILAEGKDWIDKKVWEKFKPQKGGK